MDSIINTHEKLLKKMSAGEMNQEKLFKIFKSSGYKGTEENMWGFLLYAFENTSAYSVSAQKMDNPYEDITEEEYLEMIVKEMNFCV